MFIDSYDFNNLINRSIRRLNKRANEPNYIKSYISTLNNYVQNLKRNNPNISLDELEHIFENDFTEILDTIFSNDSSLHYTMAYESCIYLSSHPHKFNELLKENLEHPKSIPENYSNDFNANLKLCVSEAKKSYDEFLSEDIFDTPSIQDLRNILLNPNITPTEKNKICNYVYSQLDFNTKNYLKKYVNCIKNGELGLLQYELKSSENDLKENLVLSISSIGKQLNKLGFLEKYPIYQQNHFKKLGLLNFSHPFNSSKNVLGIDRLTNSDYLSRLPIDTLLALNNYWCNRFIKECDTYLESIYAIKQLNLLPEMLNGTFNPEELSIDSIRNVLIKMNFLYAPTKNYWSYCSKLDEDETKSIDFEDKDYFLMSNEELINLLTESIENEYMEYFNNLLPNNDMTKDLDDYWKLYTPIMNGYSFKDTSFLSTLALVQSLNLSPNYGVVIDDNFPSSPKDNPYYPINFWIDFKGLNFPLREHIPLKTLTNFLKEYTGDCKIPLYIGSEAFSGVPSHLLFPLGQNQISAIKEAKKNNYADIPEKTAELLKHSSFLLNPKSAKKNIDRIFIDLETFEFYAQDEKGNYIKRPSTFYYSENKENSEEYLL